MERIEEIVLTENYVLGSTTITERRCLDVNDFVFWMYSQTAVFPKLSEMEVIKYVCISILSIVQKQCIGKFISSEIAVKTNLRDIKHNLKMNRK